MHNSDVLRNAFAENIIILVWLLTNNAVIWNSIQSQLIEWNGYEAGQTLKEQTKDAKIYVGRCTTMHNLLF